VHFIPITKEEEKELIKKINVSSFSDLIKIIPKNLQLDNELGIGDALSELEISKELNDLSNANNSDSICFLGGGVYDHFIPAAVDFISGRSEYYTAYTPYQAEVSQGTLQYLYEFQTMIAELSGMDIANASLYDGASSIAEACSLAISVTRNNTIKYSSLINQNYIEVIQTYFSGRDVKILELPEHNGITDITAIQTDPNDIAAVIIQSPNKFGLVESWNNTKNELRDSKGLLISVSDPMSLSLLKPPGECGADVFVGEGQSLGNHMNYGGFNKDNDIGSDTEIRRPFESLNSFFVLFHDSTKPNLFGDCIITAAISFGSVCIAVISVIPLCSGNSRILTSLPEKYVCITSI
jgi:glycine dehydrogenase subunit 1